MVCGLGMFPWFVRELCYRTFHYSVFYLTNSPNTTVEIILSIMPTAHMHPHVVTWECVECAHTRALSPVCALGVEPLSPSAT
jgi:hypothetical protein